MAKLAATDILSIQTIAVKDLRDNIFGLTLSSLENFEKHTIVKDLPRIIRIKEKKSNYFCNATLCHHFLVLNIRKGFSLWLPKVLDNSERVLYLPWCHSLLRPWWMGSEGHLFPLFSLMRS